MKNISFYGGEMVKVTHICYSVQNTKTSKFTVCVYFIRNIKCVLKNYLNFNYLVNYFEILKLHLFVLI